MGLTVASLEATVGDREDHNGRGIEIKVGPACVLGDIGGKTEPDQFSRRMTKLDRAVTGLLVRMQAMDA
jgi:hypothetical protein